MAKKLNKQSLLEAKQKAERELAKFAIQCSHTKKNGEKSLLYLVNNATGEWKCKACETTVNLNPITDESLIAAVQVVRNAVNQIKFLSDDPEGADENLVMKLGELDFNLIDVPKLYRKVIKESGSNKKNKKNNRKNNIGGYGSSSLFFG